MYNLIALAYLMTWGQVDSSDSTTFSDTVSYTSATNDFLTESITLAELVSGVPWADGGFIDMDDTMSIDTTETAWYGNTLAEIFALEEFRAGALSCIREASDSTTWAESIIEGFGRINTDSITYTDTNIGDVCAVLTDYFICYHTISEYFKMYVANSDTLLNEDSMTVAKFFYDTLTETFESTEEIIHRLGLDINDTILVSEGVTISAKFVAEVLEVIRISEYIEMYKGYADTLEDEISHTDSLIASLGVYLEELMVAIASADNSAYTQNLVAEAMSVLEMVNDLKAYSELAADGITTTDVLALLLTVYRDASDSITGEDTPSAARNTFGELTSGIVVTETTTNIGKFSDILTDTVSFSIKIILSGEEWQAWAFSTDKMYASLYTNYDFNSYANMNGVDYGCRTDGVYTLEGETDAGTEIERGVRLNFAHMGTHVRKRFTHAFFGTVGDEPFLKVMVDGNEEDGCEYYLIKNKAHLHKGVAGVEWEMILTQIDELKFVELTPILMQR